MRKIEGNKHPDCDLDKIHNLEVAATKIYFGKYSLNGVMLAATRGTVIDVADSQKANKYLNEKEDLS